MMDELATALTGLAANVGFPAAVTVFLLWRVVLPLSERMGKFLDATQAMQERMTKALEEMTVELRRLAQDVDEQGTQLFDLREKVARLPQSRTGHADTL